jgi:dihydroxyacetone synthase
MYDRACGWYVLEIPDGNTNVSAISSALEHAANHVGQPTFINIKTEIGRGTSVAGTCKAHHAAFGQDNVKQCKKLWGYDPKETHAVPSDVRDYWSEVPKKGERSHGEWQALLNRYTLQYPKLAKRFQQLADGTLDQGWRHDLLSMKATEKDTPIRQSSAVVFDALWKKLPFFGGSADLSEPNNVLREPKIAFGPKDSVSHQSYEGRYVHYGTREHAMAAISNGIAAYSSRDEDGSRGQSLIPITATFSMFQLYAAPAIRMGALMSLQIIHIGTHDSIAEGACGPTHQVSQHLVFS